MYSSDKGQSLIENAVIWGIIVIVSIGILTTFGSTIKDMLYQTKEEYRSFQPFKAPADASITPGKPGAPDPDTPGDGLLPGEGTVIGADAPLPQEAMVQTPQILKLMAILILMTITLPLMRI